jgi:hypothetical protein
MPVICQDTTRISERERASRKAFAIVLSWPLRPGHTAPFRNRAQTGTRRTFNMCNETTHPAILGREFDHVPGEPDHIYVLSALGE